MNYQIIQSDVIKWAETYTGPKFHALLCDPPYHLTSIVKRFGKSGSAPAKGGVYNRSSKGFMGQQWDGGDLAFNPETWAALSEHLYPGAFMMAFAGTRGYHRMACAMEDAGLIIHPAIGWCQLSGFPKATRIDTQVDKAAGVEVGQGKAHPAFAQAWAGHRYGLQALKPAFEFIAVAQKPYEGRPIDNITETGAGALWIDGGRIPLNGEKAPTGSGSPCPNGNADIMSRAFGNSGNETSPLGRWPANLILDESGAEMLDRQSGVSVSRASDTPQPKMTSKGIKGGALGNVERRRPNGHEVNEDYTRGGYNDSGGASRMFFQSDWAYEILEQLNAADPLIYEPKVSTAEREAGLNCRNTHPTLKPIKLTKYLATLLLPPPEYGPRRILIPFAGAASEICGAVLAGWEEATGIEMSPDYARIAEARLAWWSQWPGWGQDDVEKILEAPAEDERQLSFIEEYERM